MTSVLYSAIRVAMGGLQHLAQGRTPDAAYQNMIALFCRTGGRSNDRLSQLIAMAKPPQSLPKAEGVLGGLDKTALGRITADLDARGYHVFESRLSDDFCDRLTEFATTTRCRVRPADSQLGTKAVVVDSYDRESPMGIRYDLALQDIIDNPDIQGLLGDSSIVSVAQSYLRCRPLLDVMGMWWHTSVGEGPDSQAAQFYHFDMDRIKWLKFFIYLTDVGPENGPHCFIEGSHRTGAIPAVLLNKGYSRLTDGEVQSNFPSEKFIEFIAPRGTIIAEDTRGLHKGKHVEKSDRLMLQLQFSNSLFGGYYPPAHISKIRNPLLKKMVTSYPKIYSSYYRGGEV